MGLNDAGLIGAIIFLAQLIGKMAERMLDKVLKDKEPKHGPMPSGDLEKDLQRLVEWHNVKDQDGVFIWYFPKTAVNARFDEIMDILHLIKDRQVDHTNKVIDEVKKK